MKGLIAATLAIFLASSISLPSNAKSKSKADKKQIALTLQGGTSKDTAANNKTAKDGVGSDPTSVWTGGYADTFPTVAGGGM